MIDWSERRRAESWVGLSPRLRVRVDEQEHDDVEWYWAINVRPDAPGWNPDLCDEVMSGICRTKEVAMSIATVAVNALEADWSLVEDGAKLP